MSGVSKKTPLPHWQTVMDKAGWETVQELAQASGISSGRAHEAVYGIVKPSDETIVKIAKAARIDPEIIAADIFRYTLNIKRTKRSIAS